MSLDRGDPRIWPSLIPRKLQGVKHSLAWRLGSNVIIPLIGSASRLWVNHLNRVKIENHNVFLDTLAKHYSSDKKYPLLTIANHSSCCDDPGLWGALFPWKWEINAARHRWSSAAEDICFTKPWHTLFFSLGKTFPVVRGLGIHQHAMDFALELFKANEFLHVFPQGRVVEDPDLDIDIMSIDKLPLEEQLNSVTLRDRDFHKPYQLKWGLARIILDFLNTDPSPDKHIQLLPFFHIGMHHILPNVEPYVPKTGNSVTISVRRDGPIRLDSEFLRKVCFDGDDKLSTQDKRTRIMKFLERELKLLKLSAIKFRHLDEIPAKS